MSFDADVVVVGAGLAGLTAADRLAAAGRDVLVVDARDRVGGRVLNVPLDGEQLIDIGGQWLGPTQDRALALVRRFGLRTFPTYAEGDNLLERRRGRLLRYKGNIPRINPAVLADVGQAQARIDRMARAVPLEAPWTARKAGRWDAMTFATWLRRNVATREARELLELAVAAVWACEPRDLSLLHVLFYTHSGGRFDDLIGTSGGAQQDRVDGGTHQLALRLAGGLDERVLLEAPARRLTQDTEGVTVHAGSHELRARRTIVAISPALTARIEYDPALPTARDQLTQRVPMGSVIKCMAIYDEPFWRADGLSGQAVSIEGPARVVFDNTPASGSPGVLLAFLEGRHARGWSTARQAHRREAVVATLRRLFGSRAAKPAGYLDKDWSAEPYTRGCYTGLFVPGAWTGFGHALRSPVGRIHWSGTETATRWSGYMDGAIRSGEAAADAILALGERVEEPNAQRA